MNADKIKNLSAAVLVSAQILAPCLAAGAASDPWGPWSSADDSPVMRTAADRRSAAGKSDAPVASIAATPFLWLLSFYQTTIGPANSGRCPLYPTCSQYSVEAIHKHGPVVGVVMTADRIIHELEEQKYAPLAKVGSRYRYLDPVRDNDFWWHTE